MKIISTNLAKPKTFLWNGQQVTTGIYKMPVTKAIFLEKEAVKHDEVTDRAVHAGIYKACYLFSSDHYRYWKNLYPNLDWNWGMFGENLTVSGLDETQLRIGDIYKIGNALVQVTQPREPCFKLGIKFGNQQVLKQFIKHGCSGTYVSILEEGHVQVNDSMILVERSKEVLTVAQLFNLYYAKEKDQDLLKLAVNSKIIPERKRIKLMPYVKH